MSSYHIVQAIWYGVLPMLVAALFVGILCYFICCLNQIKERIVHSRKRKRLREARKKAMREQREKSGGGGAGLSVTEPIKIDTKLVNVSQAQFKPVKVETVHFNEQQSPSPFVGKKPNPTLNQYLLEPVKSDSNPIAPYDLHRPNSFRSILHSNNNPYPSSGFGQQSLLSPPPPFTNQMTNTSVASVELQSVMASSTNNKKREKREGKGSSESEMEQLVVQELNESPKSVFSRLQILRRTTLDDDRKAATQSTSQDVRKMPKSSSSGEDESDIRKRDEHINTNSSTNNNKRPSELKDSSSSPSSSNSELEQSDPHSASLTNSASANDHDENSNSNDDDGQNDSRTSSFDKNNTGSKSKKLSKKRLRDSKSKLNSLDETKTTKQENTTTTRTNSGEQKAKLVEISKNRLEISDIDIEDDLIFADEDDSLSSTGLCGTGVGVTSSLHQTPLTTTTTPTSSMASCLVAKIQRTSFYASKSCITGSNNNNSNISPINESDVSCSKCTGLESPRVSEMNFYSSQHRHKTYNQPITGLVPPSSSKKFSSQSDIEPDENIVSDILVKSPATTRKIHMNQSADQSM